jgi:hypothetical protein
MRYLAPPGTVRFRARVVRACGGILLAAAGAAQADPPFLNYNPEPVEVGRAEVFAFTTFDHINGDTFAQLPAVEFNAGVLPELQLHAVVPMALNLPHGGSTSYGPGDIELGAKYRFIEESGVLPQVGVYPFVELPAGNAERGLGNGRVFWKLPLWAQKSFGPWTTYGGAGYVINDAAGQRDYAYGGWQVQRRLDHSLILGGEVFAQGSPTVGGQGTVILNFGGFYALPLPCGECRLAFSLGHSIDGQQNTIGYLGLTWEFGAERGEHAERSE